ncbi:kinase-like protein [Daldinia eschscholtzii]|nr:kinase-like protein [Daldinia eschscholtzii]
MLTQPAKSSLARDILKNSYWMAVASSLTSKGLRCPMPNLYSRAIEDPESDIESAPSQVFPLTPPVSSCSSPSPDVQDHPPAFIESFFERVNNTPYTSQMRMFQFRQMEGLIDWTTLIASLKQGVPGDLRYQNGNYQLIDYGGSSSVWGAAFHTREDYSVDALAIKLFRADRQDDSDELPTELKIMKGLEHNHIVAFVGHFQRSNHFGVILYPLAICNLGQLLKGAYGTNAGLTADLSKILLTATGCLSSAVTYLHTSKIVKHKDIKPENILVDKFGSVHLADFGISKQYEDETVTGGQTPFTERYAPPEVVGQCERDLSSDIFSLGCVFLEIVTVILGKSLKVMNEVIFERQPKGYYQALSNVESWINNLKGSLPSSTSLVSSAQGYHSSTEEQYLSTRHLDIILSMMAECPKDRPAISEVYQLFREFTRDCPDCTYSRNQQALGDIDSFTSCEPKGNSIEERQCSASSYIALPAPLKDLSCPLNERDAHTMPMALSPPSHEGCCATSNSWVIPESVDNGYVEQRQGDLEKISSQMKRAVERVIREFSPSIQLFIRSQERTVEEKPMLIDAVTSGVPNITHDQHHQYQMLNKLKLRITEAVRQVLKEHPSHYSSVDPSALIQSCSPNHSTTYNRRRASSSQDQPAKRGRNGQGNRVIRREDDHDSDAEDDPTGDNGGNASKTQTGSLEPSPSFACPFHRREPDRFAQISSCCFTSYRQISRLKEHLDRVHRIYLCPRCQESHSSERDVDQHLRQDDVCTKQDPIDYNESYDWGKGYGQKQAEELKSRWRNLNGYEKWRKIYKILLPYDRNIPWPYVTRSSSSYHQSEPGATSEQATHLHDLPSLVFNAIWNGVTEGVNAGVNAGVDIGVDTGDLNSNQTQPGLHENSFTQAERSMEQFQLHEDDLHLIDYSPYVYGPPYPPSLYPPELLSRSIEPSNLTGDSAYYTNFDVSDTFSREQINSTRQRLADQDGTGCECLDVLAGSCGVEGNG